jgi:apolipoprotein N-acyltransferase
MMIKSPPRSFLGRLFRPHPPGIGPTVAARWQWRWGLLALASGLGMNLALPPLSLWPLAGVALAPLWGLMMMVATSPWWLAPGYGLLWGLGYYGSSLVWITHLHPLMWMGIPWLGSVAIALSAWGIVTLWGTLGVGIWCLGLHWCLRTFPHRPGRHVLLGTALWCVIETLRNYSPLDWSSLSLTQSPNNLWLLHLSRLSGPMAITAVVVAVNGCLAIAWWHGFYRPKNSAENRKPNLQGRVWLAGALGLVVMAHGLGAWLYSRPALDAPAQAIKLGMIQGNVPTREKLTLAGVNRAVEGYTQGYLELVRQGVDAVVTPEGSIPLLWSTTSAQLTPFVQAVRQTGIPLWLGTFAPVAGNPDANLYTQSLLEIRQDGLPHGRYDKVRLVPLGEYIPLEPILGQIIGRLSPLDSYLVPGQVPQTFSTSLGQGIVGICYESAYSRLLRRQAKGGGEFIVTTSNNDPYPLAMMLQHHGLDILRAIETDRWAIRVTNTGLSGLVDSHGHTRWLLPIETYALKVATLYRHSSLTLYSRWGDWLTPLLAGLALGGLVLTRQRH